MSDQDHAAQAIQDFAEALAAAGLLAAANHTEGQA